MKTLNFLPAAAMMAALGLGWSQSVSTAAVTINIVVTNRVYSPYSTDLAADAWVYVDSDPAAGSPVRATQRCLGYREVDYKSQVPGTLSFTPVTPTTNGDVVTYDYSTQVAKTATIGFWVDKNVPMIIGPDGNAYITDGHHTTAGLLASTAPPRQLVPGLNRVILGHIVANYYNPIAGPQPLTDEWWTARQAENNALLYGPDGDQLTLLGEPNYANLQPILPSVLVMPTTPSTITGGGVVAMTPSAYRGLTWGLADAMVVSATDSAGKKIAGYKKSIPGSSVDINFVEFFWADYLRHRIVWDDTLTGSPYGSPNGDASVTTAPLSFFTAVANGIALARSQVYLDEYGRNITNYTNSAIFGPNTLNWARGSLSNGLAAATDTYHLYLRDDSSIAGVISPSPLSTNILHIDTVVGMTVTQTLQNIRSVIINAGGTLNTSWKDATVSNSTLRLPAGTGVVKFDTLQGAVSVAGGTLGGNGTINGSLTTLNGGTLAPGSSIGTMTVNGPVTLSGATVMEINKSGATLTSDLVTGITTLTYGGTLTLVASGDALANNDTFKLFDATSYVNAFASFNLPAPGDGLKWDTSQLAVDGTIRVRTANTPLTIASQPQSQTANVGTTVTLYGGAGGTVPITYQWQFNGSDLTGQTGPSLTLPNIQETNQGQYSFVAQNTAGSITSDVATVTVNQAPTAQAQSVSLSWNSSIAITLSGADPDGDTLSFTVTVQPTHGTLSGTAPNLTYTPAANYSGPDSLTFRVSDGALSATAAVSITVRPGFTYKDTDLLLVFRKDNMNDVLFNLGNVSNYLGQAQGAMSAISFDTNLVLANFGGSFSGVKYALMAVTPLDSVPLRAWLSDADPSGAPRDETFSKWGGQRGKISQIGISAASYFNSSNQSLVLPPNDPGSYTFIASDAGSLDVSTMGGTVPFPVEQDVPGHLRLIELKVSTANPKPVSTQAGSLDLALDGGGNASLIFTAGVTAPVFTAQPGSQTAECGGSATFSAAASGDGPVSYQWYFGADAIGGATASTLTLSGVSFANSGSYHVVASNAGGSTSSSAATLTVTDTTPPVLSLPSNITVARDSASGKVVIYSASATDACVGNVAVNCTPASGSTFALGVTTVNCSADDGNGNTANGSFTVTVVAGFTYKDTDLLLVFRKDNMNDVLFNLGNVSNYLGQAQGAMSAISFDTNLVLANFGGSFSGVKYALMAVTPLDSVPLRAWLSDADPSGAPRDETFSKWGGQRGKISQIGISAASYFNSSNQSLVLPPNDPGSYTFIASDAGSLDVSTMGGTVPFPVEQDVPGHLRLIELKVSTANPKPVSTQAGSLDLALDGGGNASLIFTAGVTAPVFTAQPGSQSAECGGSATFSAAASGDGPVSYQWYFGADAIGGATASTLTLSGVSFANSGSYHVVASNAGGSTSSSVATLTVVETTGPALAITKLGSDAVVISWAQTCASYTLEQAGALTLPSTAWSAVGGTPLLADGRWQITVSASPTNGFFRLRQ